MIFTTSLFTALLAYPVLSSAALFRRQDLSGVPTCGQTCLISAATDSKIVGSCSLTDIPCLCNNEKFQSSVQSCALSSCSTQDQMKMLTWATATCPAAASAAPSQAPAPTVSIPSGAAGELAGFPACGQTCLIETAGNADVVGSCSLTDEACLCADQKFMGAVTACVASSCSLNDKLTMLNMSSQMCSTGNSGSAPATQATPVATATPATQATPVAAATPAAQNTSEASVVASAAPAGPSSPSTPASTVSSQASPVNLPSNTSNTSTAYTYAPAGNYTAAVPAGNAANPTTAVPAGNAPMNVSTFTAPNTSSLDTSSATTVSSRGFWILAFASLLVIL